MTPAAEKLLRWALRERRLTKVHELVAMALESEGLDAEVPEAAPSAGAKRTRKWREKRHEERHRDGPRDVTQASPQASHPRHRDSAGDVTSEGGVGGGGLSLPLQALEITTNASSQSSKIATTVAPETTSSDVTASPSHVTLIGDGQRDARERPSDRDLEAQAEFDRRRQDALRRAIEFGKELESESREGRPVP